MPVRGSDDGLISNNAAGKKVGPLITIEKLKEVYLTGISLKDRKGVEFPDPVFQTYIEDAIAYLETYLDISITPVYGHVENKDYRLSEYATWGYYQLNNIPVISIESLKMVYFRDQDGVPDTLTEIPLSWIRLQPHDGIVRLIPNSRFLANLQVGNSGFFPEVLRTSMVPHFWQTTYNFGFEDGKVPVLVNHAIALLAATAALSTAGNLVLPPGLSGFSVGMDGLSESVSSTKSATSGGYSALRGEYLEALMGKDERDGRGILKMLHDYYQGANFNILN